MSAVTEAPITADAAAGASTLKRKLEGEDAAGGDAKIPKQDPPQTAGAPSTSTPAVAAAAPPVTVAAPATAADANKPMSKAREVRLDQNRKAARESRRRKKTMIEELQRSVIFFSRANGTLKQQNDELSRLLMQAQAQISTMGSAAGQPAPATKAPAGQPAAAPATAPTVKTEEEQQGAAFQQAQAQAVATQAVLESQGFPAAAARAAAQTMNAGAGQPAPAPTTLAPQPAPTHGLQQMQTGATMQAMASFQQAAAAAMQSAMQGMQGVPGVSMSTLASPPAGSNPQTAYQDTMTAFAMQHAATQAAAAAAGQPVSYFPMNPFVGAPIMWPTQAAPGAPAQIAQLQPVAAPVAQPAPAAPGAQPAPAAPAAAPVAPAPAATPVAAAAAVTVAPSTTTA